LSYFTRQRETVAVAAALRVGIFVVRSKFARPGVISSSISPTMFFLTSLACNVHVAAVVASFLCTEYLIETSSFETTEKEISVVRNSGVAWNKPAQKTQTIPTTAIITAGNFHPLEAFTPYLSSYENSEDPAEFMYTDYREK
jgi:hypothetical protein